MPAEAPTTTSASAITSKRCPKCGTAKKPGKSSCCVRGGTWFKKCGDAGDTNYDHTWFEGMQACNNNGFVSLLSMEVLAPVLDERIIAKPINATELRNAVQQPVNVEPIDNASDASNVDCKDCVKLAEITILTSSLLINLGCRY